MKKLKFLSLLLSLMVIATTGCKKDDPDDNTGGGNDNPPATKTCYVKKITEDKGKYTEIAYNSNHKIVKATDYDSIGNPENSYVTFSYNTDGSLHEVLSYDNNAIEAKFIYHYTNSKPDSVYLFEDSGNGLNKIGVYAITLNGNKIGEMQMIAELSGQTVVMQKTVYTYTGDNLTKKETYNLDFTSHQLKLSETSLYEFDSKKNPFRGIGLDYFFAEEMFFSVNNITKETNKDENGNVMNDDSYNYTIEYNSDGYPTKVTSKTFNGSDTDVTVYSYDCI
jgi:hypothetical protein